MSATFSVIIPTYGRSNLLHEALNSVLDQTLPDFECLVIDDASPETVTVPADPRVRVIRRDRNGGPAASRNTGLAHASGRYVTFLDDDDLYTPERLEIARAGLERSPIAICHSRYVDASGGRNRMLEGDVFDTILDDTTPHCGVTAVARDAVVPFDERFEGCEDVEWWLRLARANPVSTIPRLGLLVRRHDAPRHGHGTAARIQGSMLLLDSHGDYFEHHRRARAFRWKRIGHMRLLVGDRSGARAAFARSVRARPAVRTLAGWARTCRRA